MTHLLQEIQKLQFDDRGRAESLLRPFIAETFGLDVAVVELRPQAISLNSFNGFVTLATGERYFFKTHTEQDSVIDEYYNAGMLAEAGYPTILPKYTSTKANQQLLIYDIIEDPSVFDAGWDIESERAHNSPSYETVARAQNVSDDALYQIYVRTLEDQSEEDAAQAPIHQLFYHRLTRGRLERFYGPLPGFQGDFPVLTTPDGQRHSMQQIRTARWSINGQRYTRSIDDMITGALRRLNPAQPDISIIGHGDAHNGNVFLRGDGSLLYFDPAFAGRHHPLLDLAKPLFHNVFAMWMYFPQVKNNESQVSFDITDEYVEIEYTYALHPIRHMFLKSKIKRVLIPILRHLYSRQQLRPDWRQYLKDALFCCPFLTMNLLDSDRFPPAISLLGLAMAVEMGAESVGQRSLIDMCLDAAENAL